MNQINNIGIKGSIDRMALDSANLNAFYKEMERIGEGNVIQINREFQFALSKLNPKTTIGNNPHSIEIRSNRLDEILDRQIDWNGENTLIDMNVEQRDLWRDFLDSESFPLGVYTTSRGLDFNIKVNTPEDNPSMGACQIYTDSGDLHIYREHLPADSLVPFFMKDVPQFDPAGNRRDHDSHLIFVPAYDHSSLREFIDVISNAYHSIHYVDQKPEDAMREFSEDFDELVMNAPDGTYSFLEK